MVYVTTQLAFLIALLNKEAPKRIQFPFAFYGPVSVRLQEIVFGLQIILSYFLKSQAS